MQGDPNFDDYYKTKERRWTELIRKTTTHGSNSENEDDEKLS